MGRCVVLCRTSWQQPWWWRHLKRRPTSTRLHGATSQETERTRVVTLPFPCGQCYHGKGKGTRWRVRDQGVTTARAKGQDEGFETKSLCWLYVLRGSTGCDKPAGRLTVLRRAVWQTLTDGWDELTASIIRTQHKSVHQSARLQLIQKAGHRPRQRAVRTATGFDGALHFLYMKIYGF
jgi:hypothetical protein